MSTDLITPDVAGDETFLIKPEFKPKSIRSFVIRAGKITAGQKKAFETLWPVYGLSLFTGKIDPQVIFGRAAPLVLEIGFGMTQTITARSMGLSKGLTMSVCNSSTQLG